MNCSKNAKKLCGECDVCIERSVFSHPKGLQYSNRNIIDSKFVTKGSNKKFMWDCIDCPHTFPARPNHFIKSKTKNGCPYCANQLLCPKEKNCITCFNKSFASSERAKNVIDKSIDLTQIFLYCNAETDFWCECGHDFPAYYYNVSRKSWCSFCSTPPKLLCPKEKNCIKCFNKSFASSERARNVVDKSIDLTQIFKGSDKKCEFKCDENHLPWISTYSDISRGRWCPHCVNKTQTKIIEWCREIFEWLIIPQKTFNWCRSLETGKLLPFDIVIPELKLILEPDGPHHFEDMECWESEFKIVAANDVYKMKCAMEHGYTFLRICQREVWDDTFDWRQMLTNAIRLYTIPRMRRITNDKSIYNYHKELLGKALNE